MNEEVSQEVTHSEESKTKAPIIEDSRDVDMNNHRNGLVKKKKMRKATMKEIKRSQQRRWKGREQDRDKYTNQWEQNY